MPRHISKSVVQSDAHQLNVTIDHIPNPPHFKLLPHNSKQVVWTPEDGKKIHLMFGVVSATAAGYCEIYDRTPPDTDELIMRLEFRDRFTQPLPMATDMNLDINHVLVALFVGDTGSPNAYITAVGHED